MNPDRQREWERLQAAIRRRQRLELVLTDFECIGGLIYKYAAEADRIIAEFRDSADVAPIRTTLPITPESFGLLSNLC